MPASPSTAPAHLVFVDFENVPSVDLDATAALPVLVTLLIGKNQTKLDTRLVTQIHRHAARVRLVEVGASGRNALDLVLAHYLGRAVVESPQAALHIVSRDKDFEPLIAHLRSTLIDITRAESFAALSFLQPRKTASTPKRAPAASRKNPPSSTPAPTDAKLEKLIARLTNQTAPRPKKKQSLLHHINTAYGNRLTEPELDEIVAQLAARGVCKIAANDSVTY